jgi:hypothetical protein
MTQAILDKGYRVTGNIVNLALASIANPPPIFQVSNFGQQIGTKSFIPRKIRIMNNAAGATTIMLGTGITAGTFIPRYPAINTLNGLEGEWQEVELPEVEFFVDMTAFPVAVVLGGTISIQVEVEEKG